MARITDRPDMTSAVYRGRKASTKKNDDRSSLFTVSHTIDWTMFKEINIQNLNKIIQAVQEL